MTEATNATSFKARGALIRGLDGSIVSEKRCRRFYGCEVSVPYEPGKGLESHRFWHSPCDMFCVSGKMMWYLKKVSLLCLAILFTAKIRLQEAIIGDKESVTFPLVRDISVENYRPSCLIFEDSLMVS